MLIYSTYVYCTIKNKSTMAMQTMTYPVVSAHCLLPVICCWELRRLAKQALPLEFYCMPHDNVFSTTNIIKGIFYPSKIALSH